MKDNDEVLGVILSSALLKFLGLVQVINMDSQRQVSYRLEADLINNQGNLSALEQHALANIFNR